MNAKTLFTAAFLIGLLPLFAQRNVILIIADDLGTDYCGFYENHLDTAKMPNIRKLLARGVRFRNSWATPLCSPTRAGMLTGRYSFRTGVGTAVGGTSSVLDTAELIIPKLLNRFKPNGIAKANIGKWHLHLAQPANYTIPNKMGYDHFEGNFIGGITNYYNWTKIKNGSVSTVTTYATTETTNNAISWIKAQNKPYFLWLAYNAPHSPLHLPPSSLHSYKNLSGTAADIDAKPKEYFKAMIEALDTEIGRLFDTLQALNQWENTDIIFIGDNGDDNTVAQRTGDAKGSLYQQGVSTPFIIAGPSVVSPGRVSDALVNVQDLFATILELFGYSNWSSQIPTNKPVDSKSLLPLLKNEKTSVRTWAYTEVFGGTQTAKEGKTIRNQDYKLIQFNNGTQQFYKLSTDPTETKDLLKTTLDATDRSNYTLLCGEMSTLLGQGSFCNRSTAVQDFTDQTPLPLIYPNPVKDQLYLKNIKRNESCRIFNGIGQVVFSGSTAQPIAVGSFEPGIYFLELTGERRSTLRFVKN